MLGRNTFLGSRGSRGSVTGSLLFNAFLCDKRQRFCYLCWWHCVPYNRSSHQRGSLKTVFLKNFAKLTRKDLCQSLFFNNDAGLRLETLLKKSQAQAFSCEFHKIIKSTFFTKHLLTNACDTIVLLEAATSRLKRRVFLKILMLKI